MMGLIDEDSPCESCMVEGLTITEKIPSFGTTDPSPENRESSKITSCGRQMVDPPCVIGDLSIKNS